MAQIKLKNSVTPGSVPAGLSFGEVGVNITDKKIFIGNAVDATVTIYDPNLHVLSLNGLTGAVGLTSNSNITISQSGNTITFVGLTAHGRTGSVQFNNGSGGLTSSTSIEFSQTNNQFSITGATFRVGSATRGTQIYTSGVNNYIKAINGFLIIDSSAGGVGIGDYLSGVCGTSILIRSTSVDTITLRGSKTEITGNLGVSGNVYAPNIVNSVNGQTGDVTITASGGVTGIVAGSGISVSGQTGNVTISNNGVLSINGSTGAITNVAKTNAAQTFTPYQQFDGGVRASGGLTADTLRCGAGFFSNAVSLTDSTKLLTVAGGISANNLRIDGGATFNSIAYFGSTFTVDNSAGLATFRRIAYFGSDSGTLRIVHADAFASEYNANIVGNGSAVADTTHTLPATTGTLLNTNSSYVSSVNGQTGAVTNVARINEGNTFSVRQVMNSGITSANLYVSGGATFASAVVSDGGYRITSNAINARTGTTYSLLSTDNGKVITWNAASGSTLTVPSGLSIGFNVTVISIGTGSIGITGASGVTLNSFENKLKIAGQHAAVSIISYNNNVFNVAGGLTG